MAKFDFSAAPVPSATSGPYKKGGGGGGGGGGLIFVPFIFFLQALPCFEPSCALHHNREPFHCQCPSPTALGPCCHAGVRCPGPHCRKASSVGAAAPAHCRHHQSRAPVVSPLSVPCTLAPVIRALSLLLSPSPPCAHAVHCHS